MWLKFFWFCKKCRLYENVQGCQVCRGDEGQALVCFSIDSKKMVEEHGESIFQFLQRRIEFVAPSAVQFNEAIVNEFPAVGEPKLLGEW